MMTYEYTLYQSRRNRKIDAMLRECCFVWNHALALQKRYYRLFGGFVSCSRMKAFFAKRISRRLLHSQTVQEVLERLDDAYQRFFRHLAKRPPKFRKAEYFRSFVYKQGGYRLNSNVIVMNTIRQHFQFSYSRPYDGKIKNVRIRRNPSGRYSLYLVTDASPKPYRKTHDGASVGIDFGLKHFLTLSDGTKVDCPQFLKQDLKELRRRSRRFSKCERGSNHRKAARHSLTLLYEQITDRRDDWQWKLAHELCRKYDILCIEDLNLTGMSRLWGRKVADLGWASFVQKLEHLASKYGCQVRKVDRYYASSKTCGSCHHVNELMGLGDRQWTCPECGTVHDRDINAASNILRQGIASSGSTCKTKVHLRKVR